MIDFLTTRQTQPPIIPLPVYFLMLGGLLLLTYLSFKYYQNKAFQRVFKIMQVCQLIALYGWYFINNISLDNSLPLYHCRIAMLAILLLPNGTKFKQYIGLLGISGTVLAFSYPMLDAYDFPHITAFSFVLGHYALFVNCLNYLLASYHPNLLTKGQLISYTLQINLLLSISNLITGGNYGVLRHPPLIDDSNLIINYLVVSLVLGTVLLLFNHAFFLTHEKSSEAESS